MKIAHLIFSFETGGAEALLIDILNEQCQLGEVMLIVINDLINIDLLEKVNRKVQIHQLKRRPGSRSVFPIIRLNLLLYRFQPRVVHCHNHEIAAMLVNRPYATFLTVHDVQTPTANFPQYDKLFAISQAVVDDIRGSANTNSVLIYNGIHCEQLEPRQDWCVDGEFRIVQISRLHHEKKGQHILLQALRELVHRQGRKHLRLDFIGPGDSEDYLRNLTQELDLEPYVRFLGQQDRATIYRTLREYHLLVQPSLYEGFGLTVAEGMAAGVPVLVSAIEGPLEIIEDGRYGWSFPVGDAAACAAQIGAILADYGSPAFREKIEEATEWSQRSFDVHRTAIRYMQHYYLP